MSIFEQILNRREFLRSGARNVTLTAMGLFGAPLLFRKPTARSDQDCINEWICSGCRVYSGCILPQALSAKASSTKQGSAK